MSGNGDGSDIETIETVDRYSDWKTVSDQINHRIDEAIEAWAVIDSLHNQNAKVRPGEAVNARAPIMQAATILLPELKVEDDTDGWNEEMVEKWSGEDGYLSELKDLDLSKECPDWLHEFVLDIRTAALRLGYFSAGDIDVKPADPDEREVSGMFEGL